MRWAFRGALASGAALVSNIKRTAPEAGLMNIVLKSKPNYVEAMMDWEDPLYRKIVEYLLTGTKPADFITSLKVQARKPKG